MTKYDIEQKALEREKLLDKQILESDKKRFINDIKLLYKPITPIADKKESKLKKLINKLIKII